jgi:hypothetical protein
VRHGDPPGLRVQGPLGLQFAPPVGGDGGGGGRFVREAVPGGRAEGGEGGEMDQAPHRAGFAADPGEPGGGDRVSPHEVPLPVAPDGPRRVDHGLHVFHRPGQAGPIVQVALERLPEVGKGVRLTGGAVEKAQGVAVGGQGREKVPADEAGAAGD